MVQYGGVKMTIDIQGLAKIIIDMVVKHYSLPNSIESDKNSLFISKFWSSLYYFLNIKRKLSTSFHPQTDSPIEL